MSTKKTKNDRLLAVFMTFLSVILAQGCSSLLPSTKETTRVPWSSFDNMKAAYEQVVPQETSLEDFKAIGFDPYSTANLKILTYLDVLERFLHNPSITKEDLPNGIQQCFEAQEKCQAYELDIVDIKSERYGDVMADLFNFRRKTHRSGWTFKAMFVVVGDKVVYKLWSGNPLIDENVDKKNPLGPLQNSGDVLRATVIN